MQFAPLCSEYSYSYGYYRCSYNNYGLHAAGLFFSACLALPWPLLFSWMRKSHYKSFSCSKTLQNWNERLQKEQDQMKKLIRSVSPSVQNQFSTPSTKIDILTPPISTPDWHLQQTAVIVTMLLAVGMLSAQLADAGLRTSNILKSLEGPPNTYIFDQGYSPLGLPWLSPATTKLLSIIAPPVTCLLCLMLLIKRGPKY